MLRPYQNKIREESRTERERGAQNVLHVLATGGGKTPLMADELRSYGYAPTRAIAHRQELVGQISRALAMFGLVHNIIAPTPIIKTIVARHVEEFGRSFYNSAAPAAVAGVDTILSRGDPEARHVRLVTIDEAHHVLVANKWGKTFALYMNADGSGYTATPFRADGRKLSRASGDGIFDVMVQGPTMSELIEAGYLCRYKVFGPPPSIDRSLLEVGSTGDFKAPGMRTAAHRSTIVGDVVQSYLRICPGVLGITFAVDVQMATDHAAAFNQAGVPARVITDKTKGKDRDQWMADYRCGLVKELVNVDIFGEGTDVPACGVVSGARPTESFPLYCQMFGRMLRPEASKEFGIYIDHVGNLKHGLPDGITSWSFDEEPRRGKGTRATPVRTCENPDCFRAFEGYSLTCPFCGWRPAPVEARKPEQVEGDVTQYGPELMAELRAKANSAVSIPSRPPKNPREVVMHRHMLARAEAQNALRDALAWWAGVRRDWYGDDDATSYRRFYATFGIDAATARTLRGPDAVKLTKLIREDTGK